MPEFSLEAAAQGLGLGASLIIAIGAQNAFVLRQGLRHEAAFLAASICILIDMTLIALGSAGVGTLIAASPTLMTVATWGGSAFLFYYGGRALRSALRPETLQAAAPAGRGTIVMTTLAVSLLNPHVYLDTVVLLGSIAGRFEGMARVSFALGAMAASLGWFYSLAFGARQLAPWLARPAAWRAIDLFVALVMWSIAGSLIAPEVGI